MTLLQIPIPVPADTTAKAAEVTDGMQALRALSLEDLINKLAHTMVDFAFHLAIAIVVFYLGKFIISRLYSVLASILLRRKVERSLSSFVLSLVRMVLYFILVVTVIGILGINTSSFIAIFASAGVAIGMALSGTLQNFAGGVLILLLKPYKVGDYIEAQGYAGTVTEIQIFSTIICTYDNKSIIIPNGGLSTSSINNWSRESYRRVDWSISISYGDDFDLARREITRMLNADPRIVKTTMAYDMKARDIESAQEAQTDDQEPADNHGRLYRFFHRGSRRIKSRLEQADEAIATPLTNIRLNADLAPKVYLSEMADSSVNIVARAWVLSTDYWNVYYDFNEKFYAELPRLGLNFPFPQLDVHLRRPE